LSNKKIVATCLAIGFVLGGAVGAHFTALHWVQVLEEWVADFTENEFNTSIAKNMSTLEFAYNQTKLVEEKDFDNFNRRSCLFMKISLDGIDRSKINESKQYEALISNATEFIKINEPKGLCSLKPKDTKVENGS